MPPGFMARGTTDIVSFVRDFFLQNSWGCSGTRVGVGHADVVSCVVRFCTRGVALGGVFGVGSAGSMVSLSMVSFTFLRSSCSATNLLVDPTAAHPLQEHNHYSPSSFFCRERLVPVVSWFRALVRGPRVGWTGKTNVVGGNYSV